MAISSRVCGRRWAWLPTLAGLTLYVLLVGADPPVARAAVMGGLYVLALRLGRQTEVRISLILAAVVMTAVSPGMLSDSGFQLSFAATAGLIWLVPPLEQAAQRGLPRLVGSSAPAATDLLSQGLLITLAAQVVTLPLIALNFGRLSVVSLITNALILPVQPLVMMTGGLTALAGSLWLPAGQVLGWLAWLPLAWTVGAVEWMSSFSFAALDAGKLSPWLAAAAYAVLAVLVWLTARGGQPLAGSNATAGRLKLRTSTRLALIGGVMAVLVAWLAVVSLPDGYLHVAFLDVGQGDAILITTPRGQQILIDGGPSETTLLWALDHHVPFWDRSLDMVVNTHPEADHLAGLLAALERYQVNRVMVTDIGGQSSLFTAWQTALAQEGAAVIHAGAGMQIRTQDGMQMEVLHPGDMPTDDRYNNHSVVTRVVIGNVSFLLPGDIEADVERGLVAHLRQLTTTVLKVPHHGSNTSSSPAFLGATRPQLAVISVGEGNRFGQPAPEVVQRYASFGIPLLRTDEAGTIEFITDGKRLWVKTERPAPIEDTLAR
jgi:competence protein ComEC